jgi:hypothetical protein
MLRHEAHTLGFRDSALLLSDIGSQQQMQMVGLNLKVNSTNSTFLSSKTY